MKNRIFQMPIPCVAAISFLIIYVLFCHYGFCAGEENEAEYIGMEACKDCHPEHVESYSGWKYSKNFRILQMRGKDRDPDCLPCHTTGYGKPGGFKNLEETPHMKNIQCESCHGPASQHVEKPKDKKYLSKMSVPKNICTSCHRQHKHIGY
jgi:hypothetical protein